MFSEEKFIKLALKSGNGNLANLLKSELGGRRCEIINLPNHPELIGKTCVVEKYLPEKDRYKLSLKYQKRWGLLVQRI